MKFRKLRRSSGSQVDGRAVASIKNRPRNHTEFNFLWRDNDNFEALTPSFRFKISPRRFTMDDFQTSYAVDPKIYDLIIYCKLKNFDPKSTSNPRITFSRAEFYNHTSQNSREQ